MNIEDNQSDKLVASHELKKLENEGKDYLIQPLVRLRALKAINIALSWYLTLEWNYPLNEKTVTLEEEYDNEFTNNLFWDCFTNKNNDSTLRTSLLFK